MQAYSDPKRADDPHALPDVEVFYWTNQEASDYFADGADAVLDESQAGWYWWSCFPGCLPDGPAIGPFKTAKEALKDAREGIEDEDA